MEYTGQNRSNYFFCGMVWFFFSLFILLKATPYQLPLRPVATISALRLSLCFFIFMLGTLICACVKRDRRLLAAYAGYAAIVLLVMMIRDTEIEHETLDKVRNYIVGFFVMPYWGWSRLLKDGIAEMWISAWCALSGATALFGASLCRKN